jgi:outer membrane protein OmpA-like peptidoglycan-associated protein
MAESVAGRGDGHRPDRDRRPADDSRAAADARFAELRSLLIGPEQRELHALQEHLDPSVQTRNVSRVLPDAIALRSSDPQLTRALAPSIEEAFSASVKRDPQPLADALFPIIGPAIRKAIAHALASMMESFNRSIDQRVSWRALKWRWMAFKTGRPFAEVVLLHTLQYRVEQVFLIHRETGLLLHHLSADIGGKTDADQISAMLTAIRDFVRDSFGVKDGESLEALRIGDLAVLIEQGPRAVLAGVVRGTVPHDVRLLFQNALEAVHRQLGAELKAFQGDSAPFERARSILEPCLVTQFRPPDRPRAYPRWSFAAALLLLAVWVWISWGVRERQRWNAYLDGLRAEPGIVVLSSDRRDGKFIVTGLRDPLARDPASLIASSGLAPSSIESHWEPYQGLHPAFVTARATDLLRPPPGVALAYQDGLLTADGPAPERWILDSERLAPAIAGVRRFEYAGIAPDVQLKQKIEAMTLLFPKGRSHLAPGQVPALGTISRSFTELNETLRFRGRRARVRIVGHTDSDGSAELNGPLSQARANEVLALLSTSRFDALEFETRGLGMTMNVPLGVTEQEKARNRRASFEVLLVDSANGRGVSR